MRGLFDSRPATADRTGIGRNAATLAAIACGPLGAHQVFDGRAFLDFESSWEEELALPAVLERERIDLFHSPLFHLPAVLPCKALITIHDAIPATHPVLSTPAFSALWQKAEEAAALADAIVCPTAAAKHDVVATLGVSPEKVHVVPETPHPAFGPVDQAAKQAVRERHGLASDEPYLLVVGALEPRKNPTLVLDALRSRPDLPRTVFVGPPGAVDLAAEATSRGVERRILHLGVLPDSDLVALLAGAAALAFPTLAEGFGLPVVEAFATSTPVVASAVPAVVEVAGDAAALFEPGDASALAAALSRILCDSSFADDLRARGQARLGCFSPATVRDSLCRVYDLLARGGPS